jgi:hypothetical protein
MNQESRKAGKKKNLETMKSWDQSGKQENRNGEGDSCPDLPASMFNPFPAFLLSLFVFGLRR